MRDLTQPLRIRQPPYAAAAEGHLTLFQGLLPESQGQNVALTVLYVPYSLDSGTLIGTVLNLRTSTSQKCEAVPRRARI